MPYSDVFKPYSDVLEPYSGVFLQKNCCPHTKFKGSYSGVFKPYSDVLKPYSGVLELDFPKIEFHAFFFFSFIWNNSIFYESSILMKLDF